MILVDAGPLAAALNPQDTWHVWASKQLNILQPPLYTCDAVLSEAFFLLRKVIGGRKRLIEVFENEVFVSSFDSNAQSKHLHELLRAYFDVPMSFADSCLVRMSELSPGSKVLTCDRDFLIYRKHGRQTIPLIAPWK
ncbi:MAG TPA: pilus assembly protein [Planctomycetota bacterium]|jgi:predicted nucleic acid-binding protein